MPWVWSDEFNAQAVRAVREEQRRLQNEAGHRQRWMRSPGQVQASSDVDICNDCSCCGDTTTEMEKLKLRITRLLVCNAGEHTLTEVPGHLGVYQSESLACADGFSTEWTVDTTVDPITATLRTTDGDVVYDIAAADFSLYCGNKLDRTTIPSPWTNADAAPCLCLGPLKCAYPFPCAGTSPCQEDDLPETITMTWTDNGDPSPVGPLHWVMRTKVFVCNRYYRTTPQPHVVYRAIDDIVFDLSDARVVTVADAQSELMYDCATGNWSAQLAFCAECDDGAATPNVGYPETAYTVAGVQSPGVACDDPYNAELATYQKHVNCVLPSTGNASCTGLDAALNPVELYDANNDIHSVNLSTS